MEDKLDLKTLSTASLMGRRNVLKVQALTDQTKVALLIAVDTEILRRVVSLGNPNDILTVRDYLDR